MKRLPQIAPLPDGKRLHLQDGPIDLIVEAKGQAEEVRAAYDAARTALGVAEAAVAVAQSNENYTTVRAPFAGMVTDKVAQIGEIVSPAAAN